MSAFYNNKIINTKDNISDKDISELESKYNFKFPKDIREHYLNFNGGTLERDVFKTADGCEYAFNWFIPIKFGRHNLESVLRILRVDSTIPNWLIPFADDPGGDLFCYSINKKDEGSIYYWSHEYNYGDDPEGHIYFLSKSLKDFIDSLVIDEE